MSISVTNAGLTAIQLGRLKDARRITPEQVSHGKLANVKAAL